MKRMVFRKQLLRRMSKSRPHWEASPLEGASPVWTLLNADPRGSTLEVCAEGFEAAFGLTNLHEGAEVTVVVHSIEVSREPPKQIIKY